MSIVSKLGFGPKFVGVCVSALFLASCSTIAFPFSNATDTQNAATSSSAEADAEMSEMRAECKAMHEKMKAKMAEGGVMSGHGDMEMSPEKKEKHKKCMELMPEMKKQMHEHCAMMKDGAADDAEAAEGGGEEKHKHCKMMEDKTETDEDAGAEK